MAKYQVYAEYKDSGVEWLGRVPSHWIITTLKRYCYVKGGFAFSSDAFIDTGFPVIRIGDIKTDGSINLENCKYIPESLAVNSRDYLVEKNQLLMAMTGATIGKAGLYTSNQPAFLNQRVGKFELLAQNMNYKYLWYILKTDGYQEYIKLTAFGGAQPNISDTAMVDYPATIPSFDEQTKIANFLDHETAKIDSLIEKQQQLIELLKEKRQAVISHAVTKGLDPNVPMKDSGVEWLGEVPEHWAVSKLSYVAHGFNGDRGSNYPSGQDFVDEGIPFISSSELIHSKVDPVYASKITKEKYNSLGGLKIKVGDIIYCLRGSVGKNGLCEFNEGTIASSLMGIRCFSLSPYYLLLLLNSTVEFQQRSNFTTGSVSANLSAENVMSYKFALPPIKEQIEIANNLKKVFEKYDKLILKAESAIQLMQERRTALISAAVTGKIDVRNWQAPTVAEADTELSA